MKAATLICASAIGLLCYQMVEARAATAPQKAALSCVRVQDETTLHVGRSYLSFTETIVLGTIIGDENRRPGVANMVHLWLSPLLLNDGNATRLALPVLRPQLTLSHGKIWMFRFTDSHANDATSAETMTSDGAYVVDIEFDHQPPEKFVLSIQITVPVGVQRGTEMTYLVSDDARPFDWAYPERSHFSLRVVTEAALGNWSVERDGVIVPSKEGTSVDVTKGKRYTIRIK